MRLLEVPNAHRTGVKPEVSIIQQDLYVKVVFTTIIVAHIDDIISVKDTNLRRKKRDRLHRSMNVSTLDKTR